MKLYRLNAVELQCLFCMYFTICMSSITLCGIYAGVYETGSKWPEVARNRPEIARRAILAFLIRSRFVELLLATSGARQSEFYNSAGLTLRCNKRRLLANLERAFHVRHVVLNL